MIKPCHNSVPHYQVHTIAEAQTLGRQIHYEIDVTFKGIQRIISWTNLNLTADELVDIKLTVAQMSSMSAMSSYYLLRKFALEEIKKFTTLLSSADPNITSTEFGTLTKDEYDDLVHMYLAFSGWFHTPCNLSELVEASELFFELKEAMQRNKTDQVKHALNKLVDTASKHQSLTNPTRKNAVSPDLGLENAEADKALNPVLEFANEEKAKKLGKTNRRKNKGRRRRRRIMKKSLSNVSPNVAKLQSDI